MIDTVRILDNNDSPEVANPEGTPLERPLEPGHYRNFLAQDATSYFEGLIVKIRSLDLIPYGGGQFEREFYADEESEIASALRIGCDAQTERRLTDSPLQRNQVKKILLEEYGWGSENFRQEDWATDAKGIWERIIRGYYS